MVPRSWNWQPDVKATYATPKNRWTWIHGSNLVNHPGNHGLEGVSSPGSVAPARGQAYSWIDSSGTFWLFGGAQAPSEQSDTLLNDLWKFSEGPWTWVGGRKVRIPE